jgi:hypothetical protein
MSRRTLLEIGSVQRLAIALLISGAVWLAVIWVLN